MSTETTEIKYDQELLRRNFDFAAAQTLAGIDLKVMDEEQKSQIKKCIELSLTDDLTQLGNQRAFIASMNAELQRSRRNEKEFALLKLDYDDFKQVNDSLGQVGGNWVIKAYALVVKGTVRPSDQVFRIGGDELAIILPDTNQMEMDKIISRLRNVSISYRIPFSIGGCVLTDFRMQPDYYLKRADEEQKKDKEERRILNE